MELDNIDAKLRQLTDLFYAEERFEAAGIEFNEKKYVADLHEALDEYRELLTAVYKTMDAGKTMADVITRLIA